MRILIYATAPWAGTGYAKAAANAGLKLKAAGHEVAYFAWNTIREAILDWNGCRIYPSGNAHNGADILPGHIKHFEADVLLAICDPWIMDVRHWRQGHEAKIVFWHPCQADPASPSLIEIMHIADLGLNFSQWGTGVMRAGGAMNVVYCPLGVDTLTYRPQSRTECRQWLSGRLGVDLDARFVIGMVAANSSTTPIMRKAFDQNLLAFRRFLDEVDNTAAFFIHTWKSGHPGGFDLEPLIQSLDLQVDKHVFFPSQYAYCVGLDEGWMARLYNSLDVLTMATLGEGFGLPALEAQACGVPVVASEWSSLPELTSYGYVAPIVTRQWVPGEMEGWVGVPGVNGILEGLTRAYQGTFRNDAEDGLHLAQSLGWDRVVEDYLEPSLMGLFEPASVGRLQYA